MLITGPDFDRLFETFTSSAFKLETLDYYDVPDEADELAAFRAGQPMPDSWKDNPWVRGMVGAGKMLERVHVVRSPLREYLRFELGWGYPGNVAAGERIGIIDLAEQTVTGLPDHDFWLFDDATVYRMHYTPAGAFRGAELLDASSLVEYSRYRAIALAQSVPFTEYWQRHQ
jgi:hypothetical protein